MSINKAVFCIFVLLFAPIIGGCSEYEKEYSINLLVSNYLYHDYNPSRGHIYVMPDYNVLVVESNAEEKRLQASLFVDGSMQSSVLIEKMIWMMQSTGVSDKFQRKAMMLLKKNKNRKLGIFNRYE